MTDYDPIQFRRAASTDRRKLGIASVCLLGLVAWLATLVSVSNIAIATTAQPEQVAASVDAPRHDDAAVYVAATSDAQSYQGSADIVRHPESASSRTSARPHWTRRIFVEGTSALSAAPLTASPQPPPEPNVLRLQSPRPIGNESSAGSNRQRAP
jgi:hypothetical protein